MKKNQIVLTTDLCADLAPKIKAEIGAGRSFRSVRALAMAAEVTYQDLNSALNDPGNRKHQYAILRAAAYLYDLETERVDAVKIVSLRSGKSSAKKSS